MITLVKGDITKQEVDIIVNAANGHLAHGGGVARAIAEAAGDLLVQESREVVRNGPIQTGDVAYTTAGNLHAKYVIHTVGPVYRDGDQEQKDQLRSCVRKSLKLCEELGGKSIAFPAISTGIYGYPIREAAKILLISALQSDLDVKFVLFSNQDFTVFQETLQKLTLNS